MWTIFDCLWYILVYDYRIIHDMLEQYLDTYNVWGELIDMVLKVAQCVDIVWLVN